MQRKLFEAVESGDMGFLIASKSDLMNQLTPNNNTALHIAIQCHQLDLCAKILDLCPTLLFECNLKDESPLHVAARVGDLEIAKLLLSWAKGVDEENKAYLRKVTNEGDTALHVAIRNCRLSLTEFLVQEDAGLSDLVNDEKWTPLFLAVDCGFDAIAKFLLERTSPSDLLRDENKTILHSAVIHHHHDIIKALVGKNPNLVREFDGIGWTPIHYAASSCDLESIKLLLHRDCSAAYLASPKDGISPFHVAAYAGIIDIMKEMLQLCPDIYEAADHKGRTALHHAVLGLRSRWDVFVQVLRLPRMLNIINEKDEKGNTVLHLAVMTGDNVIASAIAALKPTERTALNKDMLTATDTLYLQPQELSMKAKMIKYWLQAGGRLLGRQKFVEKYWVKGVDEGVEEGKRNDLRRKKQEEEAAMSMIQTHQLVAILIATVTFQATFTMPGGYSDKHHTANFIQKPAFTAYLFCNTAAFYLSIAVVVIQWATSPIGQRGLLRYALFVQLLLYLAILALTLAFSFAAALMLSPSVFLAGLAFLCLGLMVLVHYVVGFIDPVANQTMNPRFEHARESTRRFLFRRFMAILNPDTVTAGGGPLKNFMPE